MKQARRPCRTARARIKGGFHFRNPDQFGWHLLCREDRLEAGHITLRPLRPRPVSELLDPDLPFHYGRRIGGRLGRLARLDFRRRNDEPKLVGHFEIIHLRLKPGGVGLRFLVAFQQRHNDLGRVLEGGKVNHVIAMKLFLDGVEELLHLVPIHLLQRAQRVFVKVLFRPLVGGLHHIVERHQIILARRQECTQQQRPNDPGSLHGQHNTTVVCPKQQSSYFVYSLPHGLPFSLPVALELRNSGMVPLFLIP